jgi:putative flippase GtrA
MAPLPANALALLVTAVANTAANRRLTFGRRGRAGAAAHHLGGIAVFAAGLAITSAALASLGALDAHPGRVVELTAVLAASAVATIARYMVLRRWVFGSVRSPARRASGA